MVALGSGTGLGSWQRVIPAKAGIHLLHIFVHIYSEMYEFVLAK